MSLAEAIRRRATWLRFLSAVPSQGDEVIDRQTATRLAAQQLRDERRASKRSALQQHSSTTEITVANAREVFLARLAALAERIKASAGILDQRDAKAELPIVRAHTEDTALPVTSSVAPSAPINKQPEPPADQVIGIIASHANTYELIDDRFFHTSVQSPVTQTWRRSIEARERENERRERARRERMIG
jgi:hypothetical protein